MPQTMKAALPVELATTSRSMQWAGMIGCPKHEPRSLCMLLMHAAAACTRFVDTEYVCHFVALLWSLLPTLAHYTARRYYWLIRKGVGKVTPMILSPGLWLCWRSLTPTSPLSQGGDMIGWLVDLRKGARRSLACISGWGCTSEICQRQDTDSPIEPNVTGTLSVNWP